jgi:3-dehydroquinate synthetase
MPELLHTLHVDLASVAVDRSYPIQIGRGLIADVSIWQPLVEGRGVILVTDDQVGPIYGEAVKAALAGAGQLTEVVLPAGESHKDMVSIQHILDAALADRHERGCLSLSAAVWWVT